MANSDRGAYEYLSIHKGDIYVSNYGSDSYNGTSWRNAKKTLDNLVSNNPLKKILVYYNNDDANANIGSDNLVWDLSASDGITIKKVGERKGNYRIKSIIGSNRSQVLDGLNFIQSTVTSNIVFYGLTFKNCKFTNFSTQLADNCKFINCIISLPDVNYPSITYIRNSDLYNCNINGPGRFKYLIDNDIYGVMINCRDKYLDINGYHNVYAIHNSGNVNNPVSDINSGLNLYAELKDYDNNPRISQDTIDTGAIESSNGGLVTVRLDPSISGDHLNSNNDTFTPVNGVVTPWSIQYYNSSNFDILPVPYAGNKYLFINWCLTSDRNLSNSLRYPGYLDGNGNATKVEDTDKKLYAKYLAYNSSIEYELLIGGSSTIYLDDTEHYDTYIKVGTNQYKLSYDITN